MSLSTVVGVQGAVRVIEPEMSLDEREQLDIQRPCLARLPTHIL
jgi:hypothetical protein